MRDVQSAYDANAVDPYWPSRLLSGQTVTVTAPGQSPDWLVTFYDTTTGGVLQSVYTTQQANGDISVALPDFSGSIAFQIHPAPPLDVVIDIRPRRGINRINPRSRGPVAVGILTTSIVDGEPFDFDATQVAPSQVLFGPGGAVPLASALVDLDGDTDMDLVLAFRKRSTGLMCGDTSATLTGHTFDGQPITGTDSVRVVGCPP